MRASRLARRSLTTSLDALLARFPHRSDAKTLRDGDGIGEHHRLGFLERVLDDLRLFAQFSATRPAT